MIYCLCCVSGKEDYVEERLKGQGLQIVGSRQKHLYRKNEEGITKQWSQNIPLLPGFLFFALEQDIDASRRLAIKKIPGVMSLVRYGDGSHALRGNDLVFAKWLQRQNGLVQPLSAYRKDGRVVIPEDELAKIGCKILKVNYKRQSILVQLSGEGLKTILWLQYEIH
ncbi:MAG: hypothetical protein LBM77_04360 [Spirochaetaceae bacterium]|jgi:transcription antitermination factor NusG|nr:hypothetical protein [Spirochaetaceae bacterium]